MCTSGTFIQEQVKFNNWSRQFGDVSITSVWRRVIEVSGAWMSLKKSYSVTSYSNYLDLTEYTINTDFFKQFDFLVDSSHLFCLF